MRRLAGLVVALALLAGCAGDEETEPSATAGVRVYFLLDDKVWPVLREVPDGEGIAAGVVAELAAGPTSDEVALGLSGALPEGVEVTVAGGVAAVAAAPALTREQRAQLVYSLTQPAVGVSSVEIGGESSTRADFEEQTPAVLVESPLAFEEVSGPVTAAGTANTFEATFHYELTDTDGRVVDEDFVTATSGSGTRGTFEFTTADYEIPFDGVGALLVFEISAEDGARTNLVEIPLRMSG